MRCIAIDDEKLALDLIENYLSKISDIDLLKTFQSSINALDFIKTNDVDLIITDIQMPDLLGTELVKSLRSKPKVIFTTAYRDYAIEGFELQAIDYLVKPFSFIRFSEAIDKARTQFKLMQKELTPDFKQDYLTIKADHKLYKVKYSEIKYVEGMREYVSFYIPGKRITALMSLKSLEDRLPKSQFIRCHRSFIVNKDEVTALDGNMLIIGTDSIPIGQSHKDKTIAAIF